MSKNNFLASNLQVYDILHETNSGVLKELDKLFGQWPFDASQSTVGFPPSNTIKTENGYLIEMALAGYKKEDVIVKQDGTDLIISAVKQTEENNRHYVHKGISRKSFSKRYTLSKTAEVSDVSLTDGMLTVTIRETQPQNKVIEFKIN